MKIACVFLLLFCFITISAQQKVIQLYANAAPGSEKWNWEEKESDKNMFNTKLVFNVVYPTPNVLLPEDLLRPQALQ